MISISGDVWGENAISLFAVMGHWVDSDFTLQNRLLFCEPFGDVRHTGTAAFVSFVHIHKYCSAFFCILVIQFLRIGDCRC